MKKKWIQNGNNTFDKQNIKIFRKNIRLYTLILNKSDIRINKILLINRKSLNFIKYSIK